MNPFLEHLKSDQFTNDQLGEFLIVFKGYQRSEISSEGLREFPYTPQVILQHSKIIIELFDNLSCLSLFKYPSQFPPEQHRTSIETPYFWQRERRSYYRFYRSYELRYRPRHPFDVSLFLVFVFVNDEKFQCQNFLRRRNFTRGFEPVHFSALVHCKHASKYNRLGTSCLVTVLLTEVFFSQQFFILQKRIWRELKVFFSIIFSHNFLNWTMVAIKCWKLYLKKSKQGTTITWNRGFWADLRYFYFEAL